MSSGYLLDTNVVSEPTRQSPELRVELWLRARPDDELYISAITAGELRKGVELIKPSKRRTFLEQWLTSQLPGYASNRILPVTLTIADRWGVLTAARQQAGSPLDVADGLIAATALEHELVLVTRNIKHFAGLGLSLLNPWEIQPQSL